MIRIALIPFVTLAFGLLLNGGESELGSSSVSVYPEHLTGSFTGGFGEETCRSCHFDYDLNPEEGNLTVSGIGEKISAGQHLEIEISVEREVLGAAGFQLSARFEDGSQAGSFEIEGNERVMFSSSVPDSLQYVQHTREGTKPADKNKQTWTIKWQAPESLAGPVIFNIAANAANGDQSEFGDFIYSRELVIDSKK